MGVWSTIEIAGKAAEMFEPARQRAPHGVLLLHDHDLRTVKDDAAFTREFERHALPVLCPHGARSWWLDRLCAEFDRRLTPMAFLREHAVAEFSRRWGIAPPAIGVVGMGMGGQGALQLAYRFPRQFPVAAAISPIMDFQDWHGRGLPLDEMFPTREAARQETATLHAHPLNWPPHQMFVCDPADTGCFEGCERLAGKLASTGIPFEMDLETSCGGDSRKYLDVMAPRVMAFVAERLVWRHS